MCVVLRSIILIRQLEPGRSAVTASTSSPSLCPPAIVAKFASPLRSRSLERPP
jgi:hypothetical protein